MQKVNPRDLFHRIRESKVHRRCDLTRLFADPGAFAAVVARLAEPFGSQQVTTVAALDAGGLALGGAVAMQLGAGLVHLRKPEKAAWETICQEFSDYSGSTSAFHLVVDAIAPGSRVLLVDDWTETGAQAFAAITLIERAGATVVGGAFIHVDQRVREDPRLRAYRLHAVLDYDKEYRGR